MFFDWQENLWGINFCGHGGMEGTIIVGFAKYAGLIFMDKRHTTKSTKIYTPQKISMHTIVEQTFSEL